MSGLNLRELLAAAPLPPTREAELARQARNGDARARDELIRGSLRLVAMRVRNLGVSPSCIDDALQAGAVGLIAAIDRFDPDRGLRLATYAWPWITAAIRSAIFEPTGPPVESSAPVSDVIGDLDNLVDRLPLRLAEVIRLRFRLGESDDAPRTRADVAARLGLTVAQVRWAEAQALQRLRRRLARLGHRVADHASVDINPL